MAKAVVGGALRAVATFFYLLDFLCAAGILGIYSYFLAKLNYHDMTIINQWRAVEGLSGAAVIYTIFAVILTCFLGGFAVFAFLGMMLDLLFCGAMIAIAVLVRGAAHTCTGTVTTPLGTGSVNSSAAGTNLGVACKLNFTVLIIACAGALFFLLSFFMQLLVARHQHKEKKFGPSPANDYTSGSGKKGGFFRRRAKTTKEAYSQDSSEMGTVGTATAGTTMGQTDGYNNANKYDNGTNKYESHPPVPTQTTQTAQTAQPTTTTTTGPNIVSSSTVTHDAYYDPYARPTTTGPNGFAAPTSNYIPSSVKQHVDGSTNY